MEMGSGRASFCFVIQICKNTLSWEEREENYKEKSLMLAYMCT